jgi:hypothetical protein
VVAFCASDGGNAGASEVAAAGAWGVAGAGATGIGVACGNPAAGCPAGATATDGGTVWVCPLGFVMVTVFVTLLITTVLWTLL